MPAPAAKSKSTSSAPAKTKATSTNGSRANTAPKTEKKDTSEQSAVSSRGRPDKTAYDAEQLRIRQELDSLQPKLVSCHLDV